MATQNLLRMLLLLMLMMRIVSATVCCRFGSWGLFMKLNFCSDFEHKVWSRLRSWSLGKIWSWSLVNILLFCRGYELNLSWDSKLGLDKILNFKFSRDADVWLRFWSWCLVEIIKMKFDQDLWKNLRPKEVTLVSRTQPSGPLCLWQCFD